MFKSLLLTLLVFFSNKFILVSALPFDNNNTSVGNVFHSKLYPNLSVTFKTPSFCDPSVKQYSGYIDVSENDHYFFWFFESRQQPKKAPVTIYFNGGPGVSGMVGVWQEIGPCRVNEDGSQAIYNENSWNKVSNLLFIDQPSITGFSYGSSNITTTKEATKYIYTFLQLFYEAFPQYQPNDVHIYGESYGGHFVPAYSDYILQQNQQNNTSNHFPIHLKTIGIGNGLTDPLIQNQYLEKMACNSTYGSVLTPDMCETMKLNIPTCTRLTKKCYETDTNEDCRQATTYCNLSVQYVYFNSNRSAYDVRTSVEVPDTYVKYLNQTSTLESIGAKKSYVPLNTQVVFDFSQTGDFMRNFTPQVANLLNNNIKVLVYSGDADFICTWYGGHAWVNHLKFNNDHEFQNDQLKPWYANDKEAGQIQQGGGLTFLRVYKSGHFVPIDQPEAAFKMFTEQI